MPFSEMKIDKSLIASASSSEEARITVEALIDLAHKLGLEVCAEGVETRESLDFLTRARCDAAQGYLVSPPARARDIVDIARGWQGKQASSQDLLRRDAAG